MTSSPVHLLAFIALVAGAWNVGAQTCVPAHIPLVPGTIGGSSQDSSYQAGDIHYRNCSETPVPLSRRYVGWCPDPHDTSPWIQVHLPKTMALHEIVFQNTRAECADKTHDFSMEAFMETFDLKYVIPGDRDANMVLFGENLPALNGLSAETTYKFHEPLVTPSFKIIPKAFSLYRCFRFMIKGCEPDSMCDKGWCLNGGKCTGSNYCTCASGFHGERCNQTADTIEHQDFSFMEIKDNILTTPAATFGVVGDVSLVQDRRRHGHHGHGHGCHFNSHGGHHCYAEHHGHHDHHHDDHHHDDHHDSHHCMENLNSHHHGFTTSMNVHFGENHHGHCYLFSNGGHLSGHHGATLSYHDNHLNFHVSTQTHHWHTSHPCNLQTGTTHNIAASWHPHTGVQIHVNNQAVASSSHCTPHSTPATQAVPLRLADGHVTVEVNLNINLTISGLNMYATDINKLKQAMVSGPYTAAPLTTPTPPTTSTQSTTTAKVSATTTHVVVTTTEPTTTTSDPHRPMCYSYTNQPSTSSSTSKVRCNHGEVCTLFKEDTGYTAKCLKKDVCEAAKRTASGKCWECCESYLCNDKCSAKSTVCSDTPDCAIMQATGYDVCNDQTMAVDYCSKTCNICS